MELREAGHAIAAAANTATGSRLNTRATDFFGCLIAVIIGLLPTVIQGVVACLGNGNGGGTGADHYAPGARTRC